MCGIYRMMNANFFEDRKDNRANNSKKNGKNCNWY